MAHLIHPGLLKLLRLRLRAGMRRLLRGLKTPKGIVFSVLGISVFALWLTPSLLAAGRPATAGPDQLRAMAPLVMLAMCVLTLSTSVGEKAIYFTPGEVAFLFSGPFGRRELLAYKLAGSIPGIVFSALVFSFILMRYAAWWPAVFLGCALGLLLIHLLTLAVLLAGQIMAETAYTRARQIGLGIVVALVAAAAWRAMSATAGQGYADLALQVRSAWSMRYVLLPFEPFARVMTADGPSLSLLSWGALGLTLDAAVLACLMALDAEYRESAVAISQRISDRLERVQRTGMAAIPQGAARRRLPAFPWWGGAGPVAWRQTLTVLRNWRGLAILLVFMIIVVMAGPIMKRHSATSIWGMMGGVMAWATLMLTMSIRFDFRADLDHMDWLKMLPLHTLGLAAGELFAPVLVTTIFQLVPTAVLCISLGSPLVFVLVAAFALPTNVLLFGLENFFFLLFPTRVMRVSPGDFQLFGRQLLMMLLKLVGVFLCCGVAAGFGFIAYLLAGKSWLAFIPVSWVMVSVQAATVLPLIAWAYRRFDISLDTPT